MLNSAHLASKQEISQLRARKLRCEIEDYLQVEPGLETGIRTGTRAKDNKRKILDYFHASEKDWDNWVWQLRNRITHPDVLSHFLPLSKMEVQALRKLSEQVRWAVSPYYLSLIDFENFCESPVFKQAIPNILELTDQSGSDDPMGEELTNPAPRITRRYPDRLIINVTNQCGMYCRHCQRRRNFGEKDRHAHREDVRAALQYIRDNSEIRDVLITGGDALMLSDNSLNWILSELDAIEHVEIKRIGTRAPVTLPQRITPELCVMLKKHPPLYINTQFNSAAEVTPEAKKACDRLIEAGVVLGNQAVLLKDINDNLHVMKKLNQELLKIRVRPYYIFHAKQVRGTSHFIPSVKSGIEIIEGLRGQTSGLAVPTYIINAPDGYGKTPINPDYIIDINDDEIVFRTWQGHIVRYPIQ